MRVIPRMVVVVPADTVEAKKATLEIAKTASPTYLRLAREKTPVVTTEASPFQIGKANILYAPEKPQAVIIACGPMVYNALIAAKKLADQKIPVIVVNSHTIKPLDKETILAVAKEAGAVVTVEEHQKAGGLGSAVAELLAENLPFPMTLMGVADQFGQSGTPGELVEHYGLGINHIVEAVHRLQKRCS